MTIDRKRLRELALAKLWPRIDRTGDCWYWTGARNSQGYGSLRVDGRLMKTHRLAYLVTKGAVPNGMMVCHACDNPPCCNPDHLFVGTALDNARDKADKGRSTPLASARAKAIRALQVGERHPSAKLRAADVANMRLLYANGKTYTAIGAIYGVHRSMVSNIVKRKNWSSVP